VTGQLSRATRSKAAVKIAGKTEQANRSVPIPPALVSVLRAHREAMMSKGLHRPEGYVFCTRYGTPLSYHNVKHRAITAAADKAGLNPGGTEPLGAHDCRHTYASHMIFAGTDVYTLSRILGHANPTITLNTYAGVFDKARSAEVTRAKATDAFG
jgi:integrase